MAQTALLLTDPISAAPYAPPPVDPSAMDPEAVNLWVTETERNLLVEFMTHHDLAPLDVLIAAIRTTCEHGFGIWMEPQTAPHHRPATHLFEIALFGVTGVGYSLEQAASAWRIAARCISDEARA